MADTGNETDTNRRFEIYVPSPKARINLGAPNKDSTGPFGYTGLSLQSDVHLFIDANKHTLFQTGQNYCGQVGGKWLQYSNSNMVLSSTASMNVSADKKIVIAAGSGQGQVTALDHGGSVRVVPYNSLALHYRVDKIQVGLFEFMHGRRKRTEYGTKMTAVLKAGGLDNEYYSAGKDAHEQKQTEADLKFGFVENSLRSLRELYTVTQKRATFKHDDPAKEDGDTVLLFDPLAHKRVMNPKFKAKDQKHGFTKYLSRFDPYALIDTGALDNPIAKGLGGFKNVITLMRRFADVMTKYADLLTDNLLAKRAQALMGACDNLLKSANSAYKFLALPFGAFMAGHNKGLGSPSGGGFMDEAKSGWGSRLGHVGGSSLQDSFDKGKAKVTGQKAKVQSDRGPFDLSGKTTMQIRWGGDPRQTFDLNLATGTEATAAVLSASVATDALLPLNATVAINSAAVTTAPVGMLVAAVATELGVDVGALNAALAPGGATIPLPLATAKIVLENPASLTTSTLAVSTGIIGNATENVAFSAAVPTLTIQHATHTMRLGIDGSAVTVRVSTGGVATSPSWGGQAALAAALSTAVGTAATKSGVAYAPTYTTVTKGASAHLVVIDGDESIIGALGWERGQESRGNDAQGALSSSDLASVTAEQLAARIPAQSGLTVSTSGGTLVLASTDAPTSSKSSKVEVTGSMKGALFASAASSDEITVGQPGTGAGQADEGWGNAAGIEASYKTLLSWNHELQKLPEDTRNLTRPIRNAVNDVVSSASALEKAAESAVEFVGKDMVGLPGAPEAIGLIADEGITLGTPDRIIGTGGKGIVFIADGGTGHEDHKKFIPKVEQFVNLTMQWDIFDVGVKWLMKRFGWAKDDVKRPQSLGFRVLSDNNVDLMATTAAQVMALGRGKLTAAIDGETMTGIGVARVVASYASEVAGYRKVVVSARHRSDDPTLEGKVELAGQTIQIGAMNVDDSVTDYKDAGGVGVEPVKLDALATAEHLGDAELAVLKKELQAHAWPETLRKGGDEGHPNTKRVLVHAEEETVIVVGTYLVHVQADGGVTVGQRKIDSDDPLTNELDDKKPAFTMKADEVRVTMGEQGKDSTLLLKKDEVLLYEGPTKNAAARAQLELKKGKALLWGGKSRFEASDSAMKIKSPSLDTSGTKKVKLTASGKIELG